MAFEMLAALATCVDTEPSLLDMDTVKLFVELVGVAIHAMRFPAATWNMYVCMDWQPVKCSTVAHCFGPVFEAAAGGCVSLLSAVTMIATKMTAPAPMYTHCHSCSRWRCGGRPAGRATGGSPCELRGGCCGPGDIFVDMTVSSLVGAASAYIP